MNNRELKKLSRRDLLEILLEQTKRIEELENELDKVNRKLNDKKILLKDVGSLAEASLKLSEIFDKADEAAKIFLENIEILGKKEEREIKKKNRELNKKLKEKSKKSGELVQDKKKKHKINNEKEGK